MVNYYNSIQDFSKSISENDIFRFLVYRKMFTPYEQDEKFSDETQFEDDYFTFGKIHSITILPDNDVLIEFKICDDGEECGYTEFHKLSTIQLSYWEYDNVQNKEIK